MALLQGKTAGKSDKVRFSLRQLLMKVHAAAQRQETLINVENSPSLSLILRPEAYAKNMNRMCKALAKGDLTKALNILHTELNTSSL